MDLTSFFVNLHPMASNNLSATDVAAIVITGLCVVFIGLIILILFVWAFGKLFSRKKKTPEAVSIAAAPQQVKKPAAASKPSVPSANDDNDEIIAVIAATVAAMGKADGKTYRLKSVRTAQTRSARSPWSLAGLQNNTNPF